MSARARFGLIARLALLAGAALGAAASAQAQNYPWCSNFADGAGTNCGWSTLEQCMLTVHGSGGYCSKNELYRASAPAARPELKHHARKTSHQSRPDHP